MRLYASHCAANFKINLRSHFRPKNQGGCKPANYFRYHINVHGLFHGLIYNNCAPVWLNSTHAREVNDHEDSWRDYYCNSMRIINKKGFKFPLKQKQHDFPTPYHVLSSKTGKKTKKKKDFF